MSQPKTRYASQILIRTHNIHMSQSDVEQVLLLNRKRNYIRSRSSQACGKIYADISFEYFLNDLR